MNKFVKLIVAMLAVSVFFIQCGAANTSNTTIAQATAVINSTISVTLAYVNDTGINFNNLNPGDVNVSAQGNLNISIDAITNVATNITQSGDALFNSSDDSFAITNLSYADVNIGGNSSSSGAVTMTTSYGLPPFANWQNIAKPSGGNNQYRDTYYWLSVPAGQTAGTYQTNIFVNVSKAS